MVGRPYLLNVLKNKGKYVSTDARGLEMCVRQRETVVCMGAKLGLSHLGRNIG
jgi:predicted transposase YbfD/YdcC